MTDFHHILPVGTRVVTRVDAGVGGAGPAHSRGALGIVTRPPLDTEHRYRVRFADDCEASFRRDELTPLGEFQEAAPALGDADLYRHVIYRCVVGSRAFGLDDEASDTDRRGIYLPPADRYWSLAGVPEQLDNPAAEEAYWEAKKFVALALKANPNVLECLYTPHLEFVTPIAAELLSMREKLLSKLVYQTYSGYVMSQFKKLKADLRNAGEVKWKHIMHLLRLLLAGITALREHTIAVEVGPHRDRLLAIKRGEQTFSDCDAWRLKLQCEFEDTFSRTTLPERPDYAAANDWLIRARRSVL